MSEPISKCFRLITNGEDPELDALNICFEALWELKEGHQIRRILEYLMDRYSRPA